MLAEWGDTRQAYEHPDTVAALAGCTPVTKESGKHRAVHFRWACNKRFRKAITTFAGNSQHASPWAAGIFNDARASGKDHPHAVTGPFAVASARAVHRRGVLAQIEQAGRDIQAEAGDPALSPRALTKGRG